MTLDIQPLNEDRWPDLETIFHAKGCSIARGCWCMYYRRSGKAPTLQPDESQSSRNRADLYALASGEVPPGLLGYRNGVPVGWVSLGPREGFSKLARSTVMKPVDQLPVWSIICFVVPSQYRGQGVARQLLTGAIEYSKAQGVQLLEAYPVDLSETPEAESLWFGTKTMYDRTGFHEVARRKPGRPVLRLKLVDS